MKGLIASSLFIAMISKQKIIEVLTPKINEMDAFLVDIKVNTSNVISVFFDRMEGITLAHCTQLSKFFEENFDREKEDYELTVCSAGLDTSFKVEEQYKKYIGHEVRVLLNNGRREKGVILAYDDNLILQTKKKKKGSRKEYIDIEVIIPKKEIKETKLKINFK